MKKKVSTQKKKKNAAASKKIRNSKGWEDLLFAVLNAKTQDREKPICYLD